MKRILIIGGTGHFGSRICRRLVGEKNTELVIASRNEARSQSAVADLRSRCPGAAVSAVHLDLSSADLNGVLKSHHPDIVIHTAGPYQGQDYRVAKAYIEARSHYIDLADGRDFVNGFTALDEEARKHGVLLISGASTLPGLSSAVIDLLRDRFDAIDAIAISIAPAHRTPRGKSTIAAVLSCCGRPFPVLVDGRWMTMDGRQNLKSQRYPSLGFRLSAACDVPDLELLPKYVRGAKSVTFHAALEAKWEQLALWAMAWITRAGLISDWQPFVPVFQRSSNRLIRFGSEAGGMQVRLCGSTAGGSLKTVTWHLSARRNHGPEIPCCPALILARELAADRIRIRGAYPCLGMFRMSEFDAEVSGLDMDWTIEESA